MYEFESQPAGWINAGILCCLESPLCTPGRRVTFPKYEPERFDLIDKGVPTAGVV